jgi:uncharacterized protein with HEPN domain
VKDERVYLGHIRDAINDIKSYAAVGEAPFLVDRMRQDAIIRKLEIVGEAVKRISETTRARRTRHSVEADRRESSKVFGESARER